MTTQKQLVSAMESLGKTQGRKLIQLLDSTKRLARINRKCAAAPFLHASSPRGELALVKPKERDIVAVRDSEGAIIGYMRADFYDKATKTPAGKRVSMSPKALENLKEAMRHG